MEKSIVKDIPVILVTYNRPRHTAQVLAALQENNVQNLYVFSDAPKRPEDVAPVFQTRRLIENIKWTRPKIVHRQTNLGLAKSIVSAVNTVFAEHDRLILLEDDCVPTEFFFDFMARCLSKYQSNERIFGINGYTVPISEELLINYPFDIYFYPRIGSWGWATWKRAWARFDPDLMRLYNRAVSENIDLCQAGPDIPSQVQRVLTGQLDAWTLNWVLAVYLNKGFYIYPTVSQIENIGQDGSGVHFGGSSKFANPLEAKHLARFPDDVIISEDLIANYNSYFEPKSKTAPTRSPRTSFKAATDCRKPTCAPEQNSPRLSIVHINTHDVIGGAAKVGWRLAEAQRKAGHDAKMLVGSKKSDSEYSFTFPFEIDRIMYESCERAGQLFYAGQGSHKLTRNDLVRSADILHLHNLHGGYFNPFSLSALSHFKPISWTLHDMQAFTGHCAHSFDCQDWQTGCDVCPHLDYQYELEVDNSCRLLQDKRLIYEHSHLQIVAPSQWLKSKIEKSILRDHPVELIYNGVDTETFRPYDKTEARSKFGIPADSVVIGAVAHGGTIANHWKGGQYTKAALDTLHGRFPNCVFVNIGTKGRTDDPRIIDIPHIDNEGELAHAYSALDIFLYTPLADNCPLVVLEALACGVPIVSFATGGVPELLRDGLDGFIAEYKNVSGLTRALEKLIAEPALRSQMSQNARSRAVSFFDHKIIADKYENLYRRALDQIRIQKKQVKLFPLPKIPQTVKTQAFMEAEKCKAKIAAPQVRQAERCPDTSGPKIDVSMILCTKDRASLLDNMLASLKDAVGGLSCEIIVIEAGSSDNTLDVLQAHGVSNVYSEAKCLGPGRHSWPQLYNFGFSKAHGKWAMYASDDIVFSKGCISRAVEILNRQKREVAGGIFFYRNTNTRPDWDKLGIDFTLGSRLLLNYGLVRLADFQDVGGLDEAYRFYCADGDLCLKLYEAGKQIIPLPGCFVVHDNVLDVAKQENVGTSEADIRLYLRRWKHFVPQHRPEPGRLLWQDDIAEAFNLPVSLSGIDSAIEHFWHGLACFQYCMFVRAKVKFLDAINAECDHWLVLWYLAQAAFESDDKPLAAKAAEAVLQLVPDFQQAQDLLTRLGSDYEQAHKPAGTRIENDDTSTARQDRLKNIKVDNDSTVFDDIGFDNADCRVNGEFALLRRLIRPGDVVFDIGANTGQWSRMVLTAVGKVNLHSFEPVADTFAVLKNNLADSGAYVHNTAISDNDGHKIFYYYNQNEKFARMSSFYRRSAGIEQQFGMKAIPVSVRTCTLDSFCRTNSITHIDFVKIDTEGAEFDVLRGAEGLLSAGKIKMLQFEYGGTYSDANITLHSLCCFLSSNSYVIFRILPDGLVHIADWRRSLENNRYSNYLAVSASVVGNYTIMQNLHAKKTHPDHDIEAVAKAPAPFTVRPETDILSQLKDSRLWSEPKPLRLHLGCGKWHFDGYINIDYPPKEHNVVTHLGADMYADIKKLNFPAHSVDEIRLHHVFEHFDRPTALGLLIKWHEWLKTGGSLRIETPDLIGSAKTLLSDATFKNKMAVVRHLVGDQADKWAFHTDHWFAQRFQHTLSRLGFGPVRVKTSTWPNEPCLSNVEVQAAKQTQLSRAQLLTECDGLLLDALVSDAPNEIKKHRIWMNQLRTFLDQTPLPLHSRQKHEYQDDDTEGLNNEPALPLDVQTEIAGLIFSRDRPMQLAATIESFSRHCSDNENIKLHVLYKATDELYRTQYDTLKNEFTGATFIEETDFKSQTTTVLREYEYILFLVDDNIFVADFNLDDIVGFLNQNHNALAFSLRLGKNTTYSYARDKQVALPPFWYVARKVLKYDWTRSQIHFAYPLELSGSIYRTADLLSLLEKLDFDNPNTLEGSMAANTQLYAKPRSALLCYQQSVTFCNPVNMVQTVCDNRAGKDGRFSADSLARMFEQGLRIDVERYSDFVPNSPHQEVELQFTKSRRSLENQKPLVSVEMIAYNACEFIAKAIDSVLAQTYKNFELLIIDDGSTDGTSQIIQSYSDDRIRYIHKTHKNRWSGTNVAISRAKGEYLFTVDSDDFVAPDYIEKMVDCAQRHPDIDYFYPACLTIVDTAGNPTGQRWEYLDFEDNTILPNFLFANAYSPIPHPGGLKRRSLYQRTGAYEELTNAADFVFLCRNALRIRFRRVDEHSTYFYRKTESSLSHKFEARNKITADILNEMVSIYPPEVLYPQIGRIKEPALRRQKYYKYLMDTFYKHIHGHMVRFGDYFRRYGDYYKQQLLNCAADVNTAAGAVATASKSRDARDLFKRGIDHLKADQPDVALACFDEIYRSGGIVADLQYARAIALARLSRIDEAQKACREQLALQTDHAQAMELLEKISQSRRAAKGGELMQKYISKA